MPRSKLPVRLSGALAKRGALSRAHKLASMGKVGPRVRRAMAKVLAPLILLCLFAGVAEGRAKQQGYCQVAATGARVLGCTVTVYDTGTSNLSTIYSDNSGTAQANPFTANATTGLWSFYAANGRYDVRFSGGTPSISPAYTLSDFVLVDTATASQDVSFAADIIPVTDNTGNVGTAAKTWAASRTTAITADTSITSSGTLAVTGASTLTGAVTTGTTLATGGNLSVTGNGAFTGNVSGVNATFTGTGSVTGAFTGLSTGAFTGALTVSGTHIAIGSAPATSGSGIRLTNSTGIRALNNGATADIKLLDFSASDVIQLGDSTSYAATVGGPLSLNGAAALTAGTIALRLPNANNIVGRNAAGAADVIMATVNASDGLDIGANVPAISIGSPGTSVITAAALKVANRFQFETTGIAFVDLDTTPSVSAGAFFVTANTGATSITMFDNGSNGQIIIVRCNDTNTTFVDGGNLLLSANLVCTVADTITLIFNGTNWYEIARSVN